ncbi:MAG: hypothetical protein IJS96_03415 [Schwartzia sp.]|nr:hypothetical protein [Schwartzia sp. (in: firmicutes)]
MSEERAMLLTYEGLTLCAKCQTGKKLKITRAVLGDGEIEDGAEIRAMTGVISPKLELLMKSATVTGVGTATIRTLLTNAELASGFFAREAGIYAEDPDTGEEILYAYRNTGADSEYVPAGGGPEIWEYIYAYTIVIDNAENVTAVISGGEVYVTQVEFQDHVESSAPHPNMPHFDGQTVTEADQFLVKKREETHYHAMSLDAARTAILGGAASALPVMEGRINQLELELANARLKQLADAETEDALAELGAANLAIYEDFDPATEIDETAIQVEAITAGDNTIKLASLIGIEEGAWYWVADGIHQERVQVASMQTNKPAKRITCTAPIVYTYNIPDTMLYRTSAGIEQGVAYGSSDRRGLSWAPSLVWQGEHAAQTTTNWLESSLSNAASFTLSGETSFTASGEMTLA